MPAPPESGEDDTVIVAPGRLAATVAAVFRAAGAADDEAKAVADNLTGAMRGPG